MINSKWLSKSESIPLELVRNFVQDSAWWLTHPSGPVRAPKHADRIYLCPRHGWTLEFGANSFLVGKALERSRAQVIKYFDRICLGESIRRSEVRAAIIEVLASSVSNHIGEEYKSYPVSGSDLVFGAQGIDVNDAASFVLTHSGLADFLSRD